jgi:ABC-type transport system involved in multi-copper enzyme maturation permease subunit
LLVGPVFTREALTVPRRLRFYVIRTIFVAALFGLLLTSWQIIVGSQQVSNPGDLARFGAAVFQILAPLQLAVALPFSALLTAAAVSQEKDRRTLVLLLMTNLTNAELVLGKLLASLLTILVVIAAALPLFMIVAALGGVSYGQIVRVFAVTVASALVAGSLGSTIALWRESTFQTLAIAALAIVFWLVGWEIVAGASSTGLVDPAVAETLRHWAAAMSPWQAVQAAARPDFGMAGGGGSAVDVARFLTAATVAAVLLNVFAIAMIRRWNPSRQARPGNADEHDEARAETDQLQATANVHRANVHSAGGQVRTVWDNPILWREMRTWAYGKKIVVIHLAYWTVFAICMFAVLGLVTGADAAQSARTLIPPVAMPLAPLLVVSLILLNALAVTSLTSERDGRALDLLLVTDLSPKEIIFGKLGGAFYNAWAMVALPLVLCGLLWWYGRLTTENLVFLCLGLVTLNLFAATLGLHSAMTYASSRTAIATSIGTLLFLFLGVATCMRIMLAFSESFEYQFGPFLGVVGGGGVALYAVLGFRNRSPAMALAFLPAPLATFFAMTSFLTHDYGTLFIITVLTYGFATAAMLVPAVAEFDVATGRTVGREE